MFVKSIKLVKKAIFPIFRFETLGNNQFKVGVVGAGFFINSNGIFVTVAHVFDDTNKNVSFKYWGILPDKIHNPNLNIVEIVRDNNLDIFIGKIDIKTRNYLHFQKKIPDIGKSVCIAGYPLAAITDNQQGGLELGGVRRYFQPTFVLDRAVLNTKNLQGLIRTHDGFLVRDFGLFGMSGGPIFDINGVVVGLQGSVTSPRESVSGDGRKISVENGMAIRTELILNVLKKNKIRYSINLTS
ncbi:MAG: hypothetical protein A2186_01050 [Candidatus Levybacteria bacterium RIFOXYA1_FULL_41_10]|nr:MAG: hypothetical protein UT44_C0012G0022 [Candidatus Levybacteria bacterium GW2011_GWA1_39_32]KKR94841.1 MAG: hypothetical protein UU45_C0006G0003 [Candidatus Levybacteria bacterium GW2011_GWA2_41_15]OGH20983.1 MAG: hypothetical protein A2695_01125 [Candidatus Levybacteria bacterium RIFCSPHIGHO2_01_FULL_40_83]OGH27053.1 MAG: hypothetical protein A3D82_02370 [Candidatus Levybacteria bacterium RIFCSPHIGHO2_02_FULL_40_29]OGH32945.1 MAG: hypothetical protein A3E70_02190 [Candidatus Levybacteria